MDMEEYSKSFRIYKDKYKYFQHVCQRDKIIYIVKEDIPEEQNYYEVVFETKMTTPMFRELLKNIDCEVQRSRYKFDRPVITAKTFCTPGRMHQIMQASNRNGEQVKAFSFLKGEERKIAFFPEEYAY